MWHADIGKQHDGMLSEPPLDSAGQAMRHHLGEPGVAHELTRAAAFCRLGCEGGHSLDCRMVGEFNYGGLGLDTRLQ